MFTGSQTHISTDTGSVYQRGDVIRGNIFSDSQREFPYWFCQKSDQTQCQRERDRQTDIKEMCFRDDWNASHKPACHLPSCAEYNTQSVRLGPQGATECDGMLVKRDKGRPRDQLLTEASVRREM